MFFFTKRFTVLAPMLLLFFLAPHSSYAQPDSVQFAFPRFSFQLRIVDFFKFNDFQGTSVSFKYHFGNNKALRVGIGLQADNLEQTVNRLDVESDSILNKNRLGQDSKNFVIFTQYIIYPNPEDDVKFYFGAGPFASWRKKNSKNSSLEDSSQALKLSRKEELDIKTIGLDFVVGVEWFFMKSMSLLVDYNFSIEYYESTLTSTSYFTDLSVKDTMKFSRSAV